MRVARQVLDAEVAIAAADQLAMLLSAQVPLDAALQSVIVESDDARLRRMFVAIHRKLCRNGNVAEAFAQFPRQFPKHLQAILKVGHATGNLEKSFDDVARLLRGEQEVRSVVRRALVYPAIAGTLVLGVVAFLFLGVLPMFEKVYLDIGVNLPPLTAFYLKVSMLLRAHPLLAIGAAAGVGAVAVAAFVRGPIRCGVERVAARLPVVGDLIQKVSVARASAILGALTRSGVSIQDAVPYCGSGMGNPVYDQAMTRVSTFLAGGAFLSDALERTGKFPSLAIASVRIGERTNRLERALEQVRGYYANAARDQVQRLLQLLEPALTIGLGLIVGTVAVSLFHPLVNLAMSIKR